MRENQRCMISFFQFCNHFLFWVASWSIKILIALWEKYCHYLLITMQGDRFASCENIVSWSQTSSLHPLRTPIRIIILDVRLKKDYFMGLLPSLHQRQCKIFDEMLL